MTIYEPSLVDDMEDHAIGEIVANQSGTSYAAEAGDDDLVSIVADTRLGGAQCLRIHDTSRTQQGSVTKTIPIPAVVGDIFGVGGIWPVTGTYATDTLDIKFREGATVCIWLRISTLTGLVSYSTDSGANFTTTGITITLDAKNIDFVTEFTSASTFKVGLAGGALSAAFAVDNNIVTSITKVEITSMEANDDGGTVTYTKDDFESYDIDHDMSAHATLNGDISVGGAGCTVLIKSEGGTKRVQHYNSGGASGEGRRMSYIFDSVATGAGIAGSVIHFTVRGDNPMLSTLYFASKSDWSAHWSLHFNLVAGKISSLDVRAQTTLCDLVYDTNYVCEFHVVDSTHCYWVINGTTYNNGGNNFHDWDNIAADEVGKVNIYQWGASTFYLDDVYCSWMSSSTYTAGSIDVYIDDFYLKRASDADTMQVKEMAPLVEDAAHGIDWHYPPIMLDDGSLLCYYDTKVYRVTGATFGTWTDVITGANCLYVSKVNTTGTVIVCYKNAAIGAHVGGYFKKSTDYGATWADHGDTTDSGADEYVIWMGMVGTTPCAFMAGNNLVRARKNSSGTTWAAWGTHVTVNSVPYTGGAGYGFEVVTVAPAYDTINFFFTDNGDIHFFSIESGAAAITDVGAMDGDYECGIALGLPNVMTSPRVPTTYVSLTTVQASGVYHRAIIDSGSIYSTDESEAAFIVSSPQQFTAYPQFGYDMVNERIVAATDILAHFDVREHLPTPDGYDRCVVFIDPRDGTPYIAFCVDGNVGISFYKNQLVSALDAGIVKCEGDFNIVAGGRVENRVEFAVADTDEAYWEQGDIVDFYDPWSVLEFHGRITSKSVGNGLCTLVAKDTTFEINRPYNAAFTTKKASEMLTTITGLLSIGYTGSIQDVNYAGTFSYDTRLHKSWQPLLRLIRGLERAVIWTTPAGAWNLDHYDDLDATGLRWKQHEKLPIALMQNKAETIDHRVTRTSVLYTGGARYVYTGNAAREVTEGVRAANEHDDVAVASAADATDLATQLYNIFSQPTKFAQVLVGKHGFIQPGKSIDFSWAFGNTTVPRGTFLVVAVHAYMLDGVQEVTLSNNILFDFEADNLELLDEQ